MGALDDVRIYSRALTEGEVRSDARVAVAATYGQQTTSEAYEYDPADRLLAACRDTTSCVGATDRTEWIYDPVGNRLTDTTTGPGLAKTTTYTYNPADQLTQSQDDYTDGPGRPRTLTHTYDPDGNLTGRGKETFTYDLENRTTSYRYGQKPAVTYTYDAAGRRLSSSHQTGTRYWWDTNTSIPELAVEETATGTPVRRYTQGPLGPVAVRTPRGVFYYHPDLQGSVRSLTNSSATEQWRYDYDPYGNSQLTQKLRSDAPENPVQYAGEHLDTESGLYHLRARQYDPTDGRFSATDPVDAPLTDPAVGEYVYANDNPLVYTDPTGELRDLGSRPSRVRIRGGTSPERPRPSPRVVWNPGSGIRINVPSRPRSGTRINVPSRPTNLTRTSGAGIGGGGITGDSGRRIGSSATG